MNTTLLHVSDFHIRKPEGDEELLRLGFYDEYLARLARAVSDEENGVDYIIATGDFVEKGCTENFDHAARVLRRLAELFGVPAERVFVCPGNHDIVRRLEADGDEEGARAAFIDFKRQFGQGKVVNSDAYGELLELRPDLFLLLLDATRGAKGVNEPAPMVTATRDRIMSWVAGVPVTATLIIAAHYPLHPAGLPPHGAWGAKEGDYHAHHWWRDAEPLLERIVDQRRHGTTVLLAGDIHQEYHVAIEQENAQHIHVATGRFGACTPEHLTEVRRQATVLRLGTEPEILLAEWDPVTHTPQVEHGYWRLRSGGFHKLHVAFVTPEGIQKAITDDGPDFEVPVPVPIATRETELEVTSTSVSSAPELADASLEQQLVQTIIDRKLYHLGRFKTRDDEVTLGWINIGPLLNDGANLPVVIDVLARWVGHQVESALLPSTVMIGMDMWGAVLAAHVAVMTGSTSFCLGTRSAPRYYSEHELVTSWLIDKLTNAEHIVLFTDVVGSGRSVRSVYDDVVNRLPTTAGRPRWHLASVICDMDQDDRQGLRFLSSHVTCCGAIRMPRLPTSKLPTEDVLPPLLTIHSP